MAFTALRTWVAGEIVTAAMLNQQIRDNGNEYVQRAGTIPLTAAWDAGSYQIRAETFQSDIATGAAPLTVASTTVVTDLNADQVDGQHRVININADHTHASTGAQGGQLDYGAVLVGAGDAEGDILYRNATVWARLVKGAANTVLTMGANDPAWTQPTKLVYLKVIADDATLQTGDGKLYFTVPASLTGMNLIGAHAAVYTVSSSGTPTVQIHNLTDTVDMLSTLITIDGGEYSSYTALTPPVIDTTKDDIVTGDRLRVDVDVSGTGTKGLEVILTFQTP